MGRTRKPKGIADFMMLLLFAVIAAAIIFFGYLFFTYVPLASEVMNIQTRLNILMANDDAGTELVALLNSKISDVKHMELLGRYGTDGISEQKNQYIEPLKVTMDSAYAYYDFSLKGPRPASYGKNVPAELRDTSKISLPGCGVSAKDKIELKWPLDGASKEIKSGFGGRDLSKELGKSGCDCHGGIDIGSDRGKDVSAAAKGNVSYVYPDLSKGEKLCLEGDKDCNHGYGNLVVIEHPAGVIGQNKYYTHYAHLSSVSVKKGDPVEKGQTVGKSGNTGFSSGPHLHFEIRDSTDLGDTNSINPCAFFTDMTVSDMKGLSCTHDLVSVCKYVAGSSVRSYETDIPLPGAKSGTARGTVTFKQWD